MLLVLPVSHVDVHLALPLARQIVALGGVRPHPILLAFSKGVEMGDRKPIERLLAQATSRLITLELSTSDERGWPFSANSIFLELAKHVFDQGAYGQEGWYFFEADNVPLVPGWLDSLENEYVASGKPYMGAVNDTIVTFVKSGRREINGKHMVGTGIYPADFFRSCRLARHVSQKDPFDCFIQWEIMPQVHATARIQHNWSTCNYQRQENGRIVCDSVEGKHGLVESVRDGVLVVHGCKDRSLLTLVLGQDVQIPPASRMTPNSRRVLVSDD